jgi:hypothetical protein
LKHPVFIIFLLFTLVACSPPRPPCCKDVGGMGLHPINPEMMSGEQIKALQARGS